LETNALDEPFNHGKSMRHTAVGEQHKTTHAFFVLA
jgi:hypothetical protein